MTIGAAGGDTPIPGSILFLEPFWSGIRFDPGISHQEDTIWVFWLRLFKCRTIYFSNCMYAYRIRPDSAMHERSAEHTVKYLKSLHGMLDTYLLALEKYGPELVSEELDVVRTCVYTSVSNILGYSMFIRGKSAREIIAPLSARGVYPYPIMWRRWLRGLKYGFIPSMKNLFCLFFPCKYYYYTVHAVYRLFDRIRRGGA